jgi:uncharacterized Zn finger protein
MATKTKVIQRKQAKVIMEIAVKAVKDALKAEGLDVERVGGGSFDSTSLTFKIKVAVEGASMKTGLRDSQMLGFSKNVIGESWKVKRSTFTITAINLRRPKYPISSTTQNGTRYKHSVAQVKQMLGL